MAYWDADGGRTYHHTAPVNAIYGLHEALIALEEEGLAARHARHRRLHAALAAGLEALGLTFHVTAPHRLPQLNAVVVPDGVDEAACGAPCCSATTWRSARGSVR
jgi:alanine-glyoxylate transaminase/serine-glyoxylate transaminase/serine-pyruvate transaminase